MCEDFTTDSIGYEIKVINNIMHKSMMKSVADSGVDKVTVMHSWIIGYLSRSEGADIYQKDIEQKFKISRSTATNILKLMEKKGYITRESVQSDARLKKLLLTEKGILLDREIQNTIRENERRLNSVLTDEERETFLGLIHKLRFALEAN